MVDPHGGQPCHIAGNRRIARRRRARRAALRRALPIVIGLTLLVGASPAHAGEHRFELEILSNRADLISGGEALVAVRYPARVDPSRVRVFDDEREVTDSFAVRPNDRFEGLVTGLDVGENVLRARVVRAGSGKQGQGRGARRRARAVVTNHPNGGPVFSGPQLDPWVCQNGATDDDCNQPTSYAFKYKSTDGSLKDYDPANPPGDVATTTTDEGVQVPFIIRIETGYQDRDQYQMAALYQPGQPWTGTDPQPQFNHKLLVFHGVSCGVEHQTGTAPGVTGGSSPVPAGEGVGMQALGRGFMTMSTALDHSGHNCNVALQAESLVMAKEHLIESYGTLRYTIGTGCSGGSLAEQWIANAYPGIYQGILPTCSFPDAWSTASQFLDYHLLLGYFLDPSKWGGVAWLPTQMANVIGHLTIVNAEVSEQAQFHVAVPTDPCAGVTDAQRYDPDTNPGGVRCSVQDAAINIFGPNPQATWSPNEQQLGRGFAVPPVDNVGVQYGLDALAKGQITAAQFVDLNAKVGGADIDINPTAARLDTGSAPALANAYRSGMINETNNLDRTAIIDCRGPDPGAFHDSYRAFAIRARLDREHGTHANQLIWEGPAAIVGDTDCEKNSFVAMDRWLAAVEDDAGDTSLADKLIADKPADLGDRCYDGVGQKLSDGLCPDPIVPVYGTPRMVAGDAITTDTNKCQLKPLVRSDYAATFTDPQWATLQATFPSGVCDFTKPGVDQQGTIPWRSYQDEAGDVVYGGRSLGAAPRDSGGGWASPAFGEWLAAAPG